MGDLTAGMGWVPIDKRYGSQVDGHATIDITWYGSIPNAVAGDQTPFAQILVIWAGISFSATNRILLIQPIIASGIGTLTSTNDYVDTLRSSINNPSAVASLTTTFPVAVPTAAHMEYGSCLITGVPGTGGTFIDSVLTYDTTCILQSNTFAIVDGYNLHGLIPVADAGGSVAASVFSGLHFAPSGSGTIDGSGVSAPAIQVWGMPTTQRA